DEATRTRAEGLVALLTPVAKAYFTDRGLDATVLGQQVLGGHGYIREWGLEQFVRDARIAQIYEGTNGIQALDLMGRKVAANQGAFFQSFRQEVQAFIDESLNLAEFAGPLADALARLDDATEAVLNQVKNDPNAVGAASCDYLNLFGLTAYAYMWSMMAKAAQTRDSEFHRTKLETARFFMQRLLPESLGYHAKVLAGSDTLMATPAEAF
ncbi:MAG: acyl-CoA dehydrogenase C-terminal domain-containing protein, partial [Saccharospirillum sp.]